MSVQQRISQEIENLRHNKHILKTDKLTDKQYLIIYDSHEIESLYKQRSYKIELSLPEDYPEKPPSLRFLDPIYHVNVSPTSGEIRMAVLEDDWSSFLSLNSIIQSLDRMLEQPEYQYPADSDVFFQFKHKKSQYEQNIKRTFQQQKQKKIDVVLCDSSVHINNISPQSISIGQSQQLQQKFESINKEIQLSNSQIIQEDRIIQKRDTRHVIDHVESQKIPKNSRHEGVVVYSQKRMKESLASRKNKVQKTNSLMDNKNYTHSSHKNPTITIIHETVSIIIQQINELQNQMQIIKNKSVYKLLQNSRNQQIQMLKQLLKVSEDAKKKIIENVRNQVDRI